MESSVNVIVNHIPATKITINNLDGQEVYVDSSLQLDATIEPLNATVKKIWTIESGQDYADLSDTGLLTGVKEGEVRVKVSAERESHTITVKVVKNNQIQLI